MVERIIEYQFSRKFRKEYRALPKAIQKEFEEKLVLLLDNMAHPSLRVKRMEGTKDRWEGSVTKGYRFTFQLEGSLCLLRRIGTHDILRREDGIEVINEDNRVEKSFDHPAYLHSDRSFF